jgi:hypothetical protein
MIVLIQTHNINVVFTRAINREWCTHWPSDGLTFGNRIPREVTSNHRMPHVLADSDWHLDFSFS